MSGNRDWNSGGDVCPADRETGGREVVELVVTASDYG